jgi:hypothetical protein
MEKKIKRKKSKEIVTKMCTLWAPLKTKYIYIYIVDQEPTNVPLEKDDLLAQAALIVLELKIVHGPSTLGLRQIFEEFVIVALRRVFFHDDLRLLLVELEDDVLVRLLKLQRLKRSQTLWVYGYAG